MSRGLVGLVLLGSLGGLAACQDVRDFSGAWSGPRVGGDHVRQGFAVGASATLEIDAVDLDAIDGRLTTSGDRFDGARVLPIPGAEADVLSTISFDGAPLRVFLAFAEAVDGGGDATAVISLYADDRIELRLMRGGAEPLYGVFSLSKTD